MSPLFKEYRRRHLLPFVKEINSLILYALFWRDENSVYFKRIIISCKKSCLLSFHCQFLHLVVYMRSVSLSPSKIYREINHNFQLLNIFFKYNITDLIQLFIIRDKYFMKPTDIRMKLNICVVQKIVCQGCLQFWCWSKSINSLQTKRLKTQRTMNESIFLFCELSSLPLNIWTYFSCLNEHFAFMGLKIYLNKNWVYIFHSWMGFKYQYFHKCIFQIDR